MNILTLEAMLAKQAFAFEDIEVAELGGTVRLREFPLGDRDRIKRFCYGNKEDIAVNLKTWEFMLLVVSLSICSEDGSLLIGADNVSKLSGFGRKVIEDIYIVAARINGLGVESHEDAEKNSGSSLSLDSGTDSPDSSDAASPS